MTRNDPLPFSLRLLLTLCLGAIAGITPLRAAALRLPHLLSEGAILQRDVPIPIWGWATPGTAVSVELGKERRTATASAEGAWSVEFSSHDAGESLTLKVTDEQDEKTVNVLMGDLWLCSGQSNMELPMRRVKESYPEVIATAANDHIRTFNVPLTYEFNTPWDEIAGGNWVTADPQAVLDFSAVGYFFARALEAAEDIPIGIILSARGGSPIEAWMSEESLQAFPDRLAVADPYRDPGYIKGLKTAEQAASDAWYRYRDARDEGLRANPPFYSEKTDPHGWQPFTVPGAWQDQGLPEMRGVVWFRRTFELPAAAAGEPGKLHLGTIVDADTTWINGVEVGATTYRYPPRRYEVPAGLLRAGTNTITVRATATGNPGEFLRDKEYVLDVGESHLDLSGAWEWKLGMIAGPPPPSTFIDWNPLALYNAMLAPLHRQPIKGVVWNQGESNAGRAGQYEALLKAMVTDWRTRWGQPKLPFLVVQLANYMEPSTEPQETGWAELRDAQRRILDLPATGLAVAIDVGEWNDIHPVKKKPIGERLALEARRIAYGEPNLVGSGPLPVSAEAKGRTVRVHFRSVAEGLETSDGDAPQTFAVAGADGIFHWAQAQVEGDTVLLQCAVVPHPTTVRYAWANNPIHANLENSDGFPASPFELKVK